MSRQSRPLLTGAARILASSSLEHTYPRNVTTNPSASSTVSIRKLKGYGSSVTRAHLAFAESHRGGAQRQPWMLFHPASATIKKASSCRFCFCLGGAGGVTNIGTNQSIKMRRCGHIERIPSCWCLRGCRLPGWDCVCPAGLLSCRE